jgi:hypothetical protein
MQPTPTPTPVPTPAPVPVQPAVAEPVPAPAPPAPAYNAGGFLKQFDWVEIGFMVLGVVAALHIIYYFRQKAREDKKTTQENLDLKKEVAAIKMQMSGGRSAAY